MAGLLKAIIGGERGSEGANERAGEGAPHSALASLANECKLAPLPRGIAELETVSPRSADVKQSICQAQSARMGCQPAGSGRDAADARSICQAARTPFVRGLEGSRMEHGAS